MVTFRVSDVAYETSRLSLTSAASRLGQLGWKNPEAQHVGATELVDGPPVHPLVLAVHLAFAEHRPLVLTPDAVWLCIGQSLATHIELHAETLRARLVRHAGQINLDVRRDDFRLGDPNNDWPAAVDGLVAQIRDHIGGRANIFLADFSTTGPLDRTASQIALMGAMREYFSYSITTLCGIPEITLAGTPEDWASMRRRVDAVREFDLGWWADILDPILGQLEATARGKIDREFWRRLYKSEDQSGGERAFGWLNALFAYVGNPPVRNKFPTIDASDFDGCVLSDFPPGRTRVPFTWWYYGESTAMELVGGLWGVTQDERGALGVASGWVVSRARGPLDFTRNASEEGGPSELAPRYGVALETLAALRYEAGDDPVALTLWGDNDCLRSLEGIEHLRGLVGLIVSEAPLLESIAPLAGMASLVRLELRNCPRLMNLRPVLETLSQLEYLDLSGNPHFSVEDFLPIARMSRLKQVMLMGCAKLPEHMRYHYLSPDMIAELQSELAALG